ncbi:MAG: helix-turn-helix transcriptional regulator, partial [Thermoanaerobaculia bacterium]
MGARTGIGEALRSVRTARAMSLSEVATAAGISTATLSRIETGKQSLDVAVLVRICAILHVPAAQLLGGEAEGRTSEEALVSSLAALPSE